jgi:GrpB-like predicted nucleotidyltransferase (UPF0157 family)
LVAVALFAKGLESVVLSKMAAWQKGRPSRLDLALLEAGHRLALGQIERLLRNAPARDRAVADQAALGVHNLHVALGPSDPGWSAAATREIDTLRHALGSAIEVHHIGSTAVDGLEAKPILDLAVALPAENFGTALATALPALERAGYRYITVRGGFYFEKGPAPVRTHALQLHSADSPVLAMILRFRDALREDEKLRRDYALIKATLAAHVPRHRGIYAIYKGHWIQEKQWHYLGALSWVDWFIVQKRAQDRLALASGRLP